MEITPDTIKILSTLKLDRDIKQDLCVAILELDEPQKPIINMKGWLIKRYYNLLHNNKYKDRRRRELEGIGAELIKEIRGEDDTHSPLQHLEALALSDRFDNLSTLLKATINEYIMGYTPEEIADTEQVSVNTIYQRIHQAKKELSNVR